MLANALQFEVVTASANSKPSTATSSPSVPQPTTRATSSSTPPKHPTPQPQDKPNILFVGDSISNHANIKVLEEATNAEFVTTKAYSAVYDDVSNNVKEAAHFSHKNFLKVVPTEAVKANFDHMVIQAGSVDISNLKTDVNPMDHLEYFKQEVVMSAKNVFDSCLLALEKQPTLKSVVIMKQTPRYDPLSSDPLSIKPALSQLFNNTLTEMLISCPLKNKIFLGTHNVDCSGAIQSVRYMHTKTGRFDGVHLYGASGGKAYTNSVINILKSASLLSSEYKFHLSCPQYNRHNRKSKN